MTNYQYFSIYIFLTMTFAISFIAFLENRKLAKVKVKNSQKNQ